MSHPLVNDLLTVTRESAAGTSVAGEPEFLGLTNRATMQAHLMGLRCPQCWICGSVIDSGPGDARTH